MKNTESSSLVVQWDEVDDSLPTTYTITWTSGFPVHSVTLIEQSSYTITGLTFDTIYTITVAAANRCGTGPEFKTKMLYSTDTIGVMCNIVPTIIYYTNSTTIVSPGNTANSSATTTKVFVSSTTTTTFASSITYYTNSTTIVSPGSTANFSATTTKVFVSPTTTTTFASSITYYTNSTTIVSPGSTANSSATTTKVFVSPTTTANFASSSDKTSTLMFEYVYSYSHCRNYNYGCPFENIYFVPPILIVYKIC